MSAKCTAASSSSTAVIHGSTNRGSQNFIGMRGAHTPYIVAVTVRLSGGLFSPCVWTMQTQVWQVQVPEFSLGMLRYHKALNDSLKKYCEAVTTMTEQYLTSLEYMSGSKTVEALSQEGLQFAEDVRKHVEDQWPRLVSEMTSLQDKRSYGATELMCTMLSKVQQVANQVTNTAPEEIRLHALDKDTSDGARSPTAVPVFRSLSNEGK